eukprot:GHRQ01022576.1.p2 GENE.GHRQ01022576.1~~GHRQ01022576.1.p2  ORF type:complete len:107 (-),score=5.61 GHRQ01022576.1:549-869(-)
MPLSMCLATIRLHCAVVGHVSTGAPVDTCQICSRPGMCGHNSMQDNKETRSAVPGSMLATAHARMKECAPSSMLNHMLAAVTSLLDKPDWRLNPDPATRYRLPCPP